MQAFLISIAFIALAEIGDKTQLLAFLLSAEFKKPLPIILGILFATLINHFFSGIFGVYIFKSFSDQSLRWIVGISFIIIAAWTLIPDKIEKDEKLFSSYLGVFGTSFITFFMAEMGDKTQVTTISLAAHYGSPLAVISGSTIGMLLADIPAVYFGKFLAERIPKRMVHIVASVVFMITGFIVIFY